MFTRLIRAAFVDANLIVGHRPPIGRRVLVKSTLAFRVFRAVRSPVRCAAPFLAVPHDVPGIDNTIRGPSGRRCGSIAVAAHRLVPGMCMPGMFVIDIEPPAAATFTCTVMGAACSKVRVSGNVSPSFSGCFSLVSIT